MTRRQGLALAVIMGLAAALAHGQSTPPTSGQTFRTNTDVVMVDVSVKRGNVPVTGLTAADFQLRDNEIAQRIESVEATAVPLDVTLVLDVSGFPQSRLPRASAPEMATSLLNAEVARLAATLRPFDRVRVIAADTYVHQVVPLSPAQSIPTAAPIASGGGSSSFDAILAAVLQPVDPARRHVVIAGVKVFDTMSAVEAETVRDVAARSDALLHVVLMQTDSAQGATQENFQCDRANVCTPVARSWSPHFRLLIEPLERTDMQGTVHVPQLEEAGLALQAGAVASGGALHQGELLSAPTLASTLAKALDDFRISYVLRFTPRGVKREGWHTLAVMVPGARGATVRARNGYAIDVDAGPTEPIASPASSKPVVPLAAPRTPAEFVAAYDRGDRAAIRLGLQRTADPVRLLQDIVAAGNPWPGSARREADYALELADAGLTATGMGGVVVTAEVGRLLGRFSKLVRNPIEADAFERAWLWAAICLAEGKFLKMAAAPLVDYALLRLPNDPNFVLARAIVADQRWRAHGTVGAGGASARDEQVTEAHVSEILAKYRAASAFDETRTEAYVRSGWFLHRIGRHADALSVLETAPVATRDPAMNYLRHLFMGHALIALHRLDDAIAAYQSAVKDVPDAQSGRVALMSALAARGDNAAAEALGQQIETAASAGDPWFNYWFGDARWYEQARDAVRALSSSGAPGSGKAAGR